MKKKDERGFALIMAIILSLSIGILGATAIYVSELGSTSAKAEYRYHIAEKNANYAMMSAVEDIVQEGTTCGFEKSYPTDKGSSTVKTMLSSGYCFIWSEGSVGQARVVKVGIITSGGPSQYGAVTLRGTQTSTSCTIGGSGSLVSCDETCRTPALVTGNVLQNPSKWESIVTTCPNNPKGLTALVDPYYENAFYPYDYTGSEVISKISGMVFDGFSNRADLLNALEGTGACGFGVKLDDDDPGEGNTGAPLGFMGTETTLNLSSGPDDCNLGNNCYHDVCKISINPTTTTATASGATVSVGGENFVWQKNSSPQVWRWTKSGKTTDCLKLDITSSDSSKNSKLIINSFNSDSEGGKIAADTIEFNGNAQGVTLVARQNVKISGNHITVTNVNLFTKSYTINANNSAFTGGIIYSGGSSSTINVVSNTKIGSETNPTLFISDGGLSLGHAGTPDIYGLIYITENGSTNLSGSGNFKVYGAIISNSLNNSCSLTGNYEVKFDKQVIDGLRNKFGCIKTPSCASQSIRYPLTTTKTITY